ncbi:MerR family transcriptional regulator [Desulfovibrio subterraneus]|jgi:DNA-binding transcriptional MerR regulator|uniref:MerR family transcriptional regulator n=1 Tax=Desulfovibrio subterraneus TaxID=2718620 RepID=UPI0022B8C334|nr:MerR family transcriptional regulator [Desulfovibrio subterraneus]WBF66223.1 MerR family transcriptional regulator [Desulfovibrio subterraneus]
MNCKAKYSIGDVSRICNVSRKTLRYYDDINLITPERQNYNNYRYYSHEALLTLPVIKFYKQMGFTLEEMRRFIEENRESGQNYYSIKTSFSNKIKELERVQREIDKQYVSIKGWHDLITEAELVLASDTREVAIKYVEGADYLYQKQVFNNDFKSSIINIDWTNYLDSLNMEITGPVMLNFLSLKNRTDEHPKQIVVMQKPLRPAPEGTTIRFGECMMAACYHIGPHETINETYTKMFKWAERYGYSYVGGSYERYVTDYWTTKNSDQFVTEVLIKVSR